MWDGESGTACVQGVGLRKGMFLWWDCFGCTCGEGRSVCSLKGLFMVFCSRQRFRAAFLRAGRSLLWWEGGSA